jgi:hypothetical protein
MLVSSLPQPLEGADGVGLFPRSYVFALTASIFLPGRQMQWSHIRTQHSVPWGCFAGEISTITSLLPPSSQSSPKHTDSSFILLPASAPESQNVDIWIGRLSMAWGEHWPPNQRGKANGCSQAPPEGTQSRRGLPRVEAHSSPDSPLASWWTPWLSLCPGQSSGLPPVLLQTWPWVTPSIVDLSLCLLPVLQYFSQYTPQSFVSIPALQFLSLFDPCVLNAFPLLSTHGIEAEGYTHVIPMWWNEFPKNRPSPSMATKESTKKSLQEISTCFLEKLNLLSF